MLLCLRFRKYCIRKSQIAYLYSINFCQVGLWSIKIYKNQKRKVLLGRDRGVKRLKKPKVFVDAARENSKIRE